MSITFTVRGPTKESVSEFYYHFYRSLRRAVEGGPELELLYCTPDELERSFDLKNAGIPALKAACDAIEDKRGCQVVAPAEYTIPEPVVEEPVADEPAVEETVIEEPADPAPEPVPVVAAPVNRRGRRRTK
jgi:hypothetical protein